MSVYTSLYSQSPSADLVLSPACVILAANVSSDSVSFSESISFS
jgi:hypothetical protein